ncbi:MAG: beta-propeller fold lactonase family protein [Armatimonadota bacterium]
MYTRSQFDVIGKGVMHKIKRLSKTIIFGGLVIGIGLISGCAGQTIGGQFAAEFVYVATGGGVAQYAVNISGQLAPMSPAEVVTTPTATTSVWVAASKNAKYAYTANGPQGKISQYSISAAGTLVALTPPTVVSGTNTNCVAITPDTKFVYAINQGDDTIKQFAIGSDGTLSVLTPATVGINSGGETMVISPDGKYLYACCSGGSAIDAFSIGTNGQLTPLSVPSYSVLGATGATISPDGKYLYCPSNTDTAQFSIGTNGALTPLSPATVAGPGIGNTSFAVSADGKYGYLGVFNGGNPGSPVGQYSIGTSGTLSPLSPASVPAGNAPVSIITEPAGNYVFVANSNDHRIYEYLVGIDGTLSPETPAFVTPSGARQMCVITR